MEQNIAIFGGSFNPPGVHHRSIAIELAKHFDKVYIIPSGPRPDKPVTNELTPAHRAKMSQLCFQDLEKVEVVLFDVENPTFTRTYDLNKLFAKEGNIYHVVGTDLITGGKFGKSAIQETWYKGKEVWENISFAVITRPGYNFDTLDLPPKNKVVNLDIKGSSYEIRRRIKDGLDIKGLVTDELYNYIIANKLYKN